MKKIINYHLCIITKVIVLALFPCWIYAQTPVNPYLPDTNSPSAPTGYVYAWGDEFNYTGSPDTSLWAEERGFIRGQELQYYQMKNATVADGRLLITAKKESVLNEKYDASSQDWRLNRQYSEYTSASIIGKGKHYFLFGRIEVRAKIDTASSNFPAIWTCGINKYWPHNGEIDLMEYYYAWADGVYQGGVTANFAAGTNIDWDSKWNATFTKLSYFSAKDADWVNKYHVWRMDWNADSVYLYLDDELRNSISINEFKNTDGSITFHNPQFMMLNLAVKPPTGYPTTPTKFEVDYFRVYQKTLDTQKPSSVTSLKAVNIGANSCLLSWKPSSDNKGVYRYDIYNNGIFDGAYVGSTTSNSFLVAGLSPNSSNSFTVLALDSVGNYSNASSPLVVTTEAYSTISAGVFAIANNNSGKVLSPLNASTANGANIVQVTYTGLKTQKWSFANLGNGYWSIKNAENGLSMDISGGSSEDGASNIQWTYSGANNQQWQLVPSGNFYNIVNRNSGKYLDINAASVVDNAQDLQWTSNSAKNQLFSFIPQPTETSDKVNVISSTISNTTSSLNIQSTISGTVYYVLLKKTSSAPSDYLAIVSPTSSVNEGNISCSAGQTQCLSFANLPLNTEYVLYMVVLNDSTIGSISSFGFTTPKYSQSITFNSLSTALLGDADFSPAAVASSSLAVTYTSSNTAVATIVNGKIHIVGIGSTTITASQAGDSSYNPATSVSQVLQVKLGGTFSIIASHSGKALDVSGGSLVDGASIIQWTYGGSSNQQWVITNISGDEYKIISAKSGKALDVSTGSTANGASIIQWTYSGSSNQIWTITSNGDGTYSIKSKSSSKSLDITSYSMADGAL